jgi:light-regulated signal transduction histidine kinase (bacteriophytochrome)
LEAFSLSVSHDLRAPLRQMNGFARLLADRAGPQLGERETTYLRHIQAAGHRMSRLIDDLLAYAKLGHQELHRAKVDLRALVTEAQALLEPETAGRPIRWEVGELPMVNGDFAMLRQVLVNLLGNAVKFTRPRAEATIVIGHRLENGHHVIFVRDNGVGFDPRHADRLFGVFQRLHSQQEFEGTGIGLANVRRIIERHGGRAWAEGEPDRGATVSFSLPPQRITG